MGDRAQQIILWEDQSRITIKICEMNFLNDDDIAKLEVIFAQEFSKIPTTEMEAVLIVYPIDRFLVHAVLSVIIDSKRVLATMDTFLFDIVGLIKKILRVTTKDILSRIYDINEEDDEDNNSGDEDDDDDDDDDDGDDQSEPLDLIGFNIAKLIAEIQDSPREPIDDKNDSRQDKDDNL